METQIVTESDVCSRCNGKGELKTFAHIKGGICFNCWGCGSDLRGEIRLATRALTDLRRQWLYLARKARRTAPGVDREALTWKMESIVTRGLAAARRVERLLSDLESLASKYRS